MINSFQLSVVACIGLASVPAIRAEDPADPRPNIILISVDTLRADHLGCYGYEQETSPFLDSLAQRGVRFESAMCQATWTLPSHISMHTSLYPHSHGVQTDQETLGQSVTTLAEVLQKEGYSTTAFISWVYVSSKYGIAQGFEHYHELLPPEDKVGESTRASIKAIAFVNRVMEWVDSVPKRPFFLFLHTFDPHLDYEPPAAYRRLFDPKFEDLSRGSIAYLKPFIKDLHKTPSRISKEDLRHAIALYDAEIRYTDDQLKRLFHKLEEASLLDNTLIVFTSDHGEEHDDHGSMEGHQWTLYEETLRVPLIVRFPKDAYAGTTVRAVVQSIDIAPTILRAANLTIPQSFEGRDLTEVVASGGEDDGHMAFSELQRFNQKWAVRTSRYKLIETKDTGTNRRGVPVVAGYELYDLVKDPEERRNIYDDSLPIARRLREALDAWKAKGENAPAASQPADEPDLTSDDLKRLKSLGYVE